MSLGLNIAGNKANLCRTQPNTTGDAGLNCPIDIRAGVAFPPATARANLMLAVSNDQYLLSLHL